MKITKKEFLVHIMCSNIKDKEQIHNLVKATTCKGFYFDDKDSFVWRAVRDSIDNLYGKTFNFENMELLNRALNLLHGIEEMKPKEVL